MQDGRLLLGLLQARGRWHLKLINRTLFASLQSTCRSPANTPSTALVENRVRRAVPSDSCPAAPRPGTTVHNVPFPFPSGTPTPGSRVPLTPGRYFPKANRTEKRRLSARPRPALSGRSHPGLPRAVGAPPGLIRTRPPEPPAVHCRESRPIRAPPGPAKRPVRASRIPRCTHIRGPPPARSPGRAPAGSPHLPRPRATGRPDSSSTPGTACFRPPSPARAQSSPLTAVEPFFTASCAYSTWKRWPSGEKTVMARS